MKQIKEMQANSIYLLKGECGANSVFFENKKEAKLFTNLVDYYLHDYAEVNSFQNSKDGWILIITLKSENKIKEAYRKRREKSKKCKSECTFEEVWRIISEQIRILLSCYVKTTNARNEREGGKVKSSYKRHYFDNLEEAIKVMQEMEEQEIDQSQPKARYRGVKALFRITKEALKNSVYFGCKYLRERLKWEELGMRCLCLLDYFGDVLHDRINMTILEHKTNISY